MTTEERESKSADWRRDNLGKNAVSSGVSNFAFDPEKECYCNLCERHYKNYERFKIHMKKHYC